MRLLNDEYLDEAIKCVMCTNPTHTNRGCDGLCNFNSSMYKDIMNTIESFCCRDEFDLQTYSQDEIHKFARWLQTNGYYVFVMRTPDGVRITDDITVNDVISAYNKSVEEREKNVQDK